MSIATEALKRAVEEIKADETPAQIAARFGWSVGQRDMAINMQMQRRTLAEIKAEIGRPAVEIAKVLKLNREPKKPSRFLAPETLDIMLRLRREGFKATIIAEILNADGNRTSRGNLWTRQRIYCARHRMKKGSQ